MEQEVRKKNPNLKTKHEINKKNAPFTAIFEAKHIALHVNGSNARRCDKSHTFERARLSIFNLHLSS